LAGQLGVSGVSGPIVSQFDRVANIFATSAMLRVRGDLLKTVDDDNSLPVQVFRVCPRIR
jgi:hypothetical protein